MEKQPKTLEETVFEAAMIEDMTGIQGLQQIAMQRYLNKEEPEVDHHFVD